MSELPLASKARTTRSIDPNVPEAYYQLGLAYGRLKRTSDAQSAMATFKRLSDAEKKREDEDLREVVKRLSNVRF